MVIVVTTPFAPTTSSPATSVAPRSATGRCRWSGWDAAALRPPPAEPAIVAGVKAQEASGQRPQVSVPDGPRRRTSARDKPGPREGIGRATPERVGGLLGVPTGDVGRGMAEIPAALLEWHPVVDEERRGSVADPVGAERPQGPATSVIAAGQHQRERIHRERARFT